MYWNPAPEDTDNKISGLTLTWDVLKFANLMPHIIIGQD